MMCISPDSGFANFHLASFPTNISFLMERGLTCPGNGNRLVRGDCQAYPQLGQAYYFDRCA